MKEKICVFGAGAYFASKRECLEKRYEVKAFIDNRLPQGQTEIKDNITVYHPDDWKQLSGDMKIILMSADWMSMWKQLISMEIDDSRILFALEMQPYYDTTEELISERNIHVFSDSKKVIFQENEHKTEIISEQELKKYFRSLFNEKYPYIKLIAEMPMKPSSRRFGFERGMAVDRVFIEDFIKKNSNLIRGTVIEIGDDRYMSEYKGQIENSIVMHVNGWGGIKGDLSTGEGIDNDLADCLICTQTLQHIYDIHPCIKNIYRLLKPGGTALVTNGCLAELSLYDYHNWGEYWKFTDQTAARMFGESFKMENVTIETYGNMKIAMAFLYGMCAEELLEDDFLYRDEQYPMIIAIKATK